jgi:hypothetical protein
MAGLLSEREGPVATSGSGSINSHSSASLRVGIWEARQENGKTNFVRSSQAQQDWPYWANMARIEAKGAKRRIVLIGESVARGFLYDPQFNPAMVLESLLHFCLGKDNVEVIDLARTNLGSELRELALSALLLEPDALIVFSGNNHLNRLESTPVSELEAALCERGVPGLKQWAENHLGNSIREIVNDVASSYRAKGVPLIWIVPEFNLIDWKDVPTNAPYLRTGANREWILCRQEAENALRNDNFDVAIHLAQKMIELDEGVCTTGFYLLAECCRNLGMQEQQRQYLELARDSGVWDRSYPVSPRSFSVVQKSLREEAANHGNAMVDLPAIFADYLQGGIPDRRLFLDYCHLTVEGMHIAMAVAASRVVGSFGCEVPPWRELMKSAVSPPRRVKAEAAFLAAVHNAHYHQSSEIVLHYCTQAIQAAPEIGRVMLHYIDLQTRRTPLLMSRAAELISALDSPLVQHYLLGFNPQQFDTVLLAAIATATAKVAADASKKLSRLGHQTDRSDQNSVRLLEHYENLVASLQEVSAEVEEKLLRLRRELHSVKGREIDLLNYYYCSSARQPQEIMWNRHSAGLPHHGLSQFYKAYWLESKFVFWAESGCAVNLRLTCRLPATNQLSKGVGSIRVNGWHAGDIALNQCWETWDISVPATEIADGQNEIVVHWPIPDFPGIQVFETIADDMAQGIVPEFYCLFGEIHSFLASHNKAENHSCASP